MCFAPIIQVSSTYMYLFQTLGEWAKVHKAFCSTSSTTRFETKVITQHSVKRTFFGGLLLCLGDNLGSNTIGGFKESFSFSLRFCRTCYVTQDVYKTLSDSSQFELCSDEKHCQECDSLNGPLHDHFSKTYGINRRSSLLDVSHFSFFTGGLAHDVMHDLLEGVATIEMCLLLQHCLLSKQYLNIDDSITA